RRTHAREHLPGRAVDDEIRDVVERRRVAVDDREPAAVGERLVREPRHGPHLERGADDEQQPGAARKLRRPLDRPGREQLAEHDDTRLQDGGAVRAAGQRQQRPDVRLAPAAREAHAGPDRAVHLDDVARAGGGMETVDVLRHDRMHEPLRLERGERLVRGVRPRVAEDVEPQRVELPHALRVPAEGVDRRHLVRVEALPDAVRAAEVRDPALGRHAGARQRHARPVRANEFCEHDGLVHGFSFSAPIRVRFAETDAQGIAHNANYAVWFEVARVEYLERHAGGYQRLRDLGLEAVVLETHVRYLRPARFDDRLLVHARCLDVRGARFRYEYAVERDGSLIADGWTLHATVAAGTMGPSPPASASASASSSARRG